MLTEVDRLLCIDYRHGVRTHETRAAWARYSRERRRQQYAIRDMHNRRAPGVPYVAEGVSHGVSCYQNFGCQCRVGRRAVKMRRALGHVT